MGSAAAAPQRRDRRPPPPRCCFGTRSRSITTSTRPAATCGESRGRQPWHGWMLLGRCPRPAAARPSALPVPPAPLPLSERHLLFFFCFLFFLLYFFSAWLDSSLRRCSLACAGSLFSGLGQRRSAVKGLRKAPAGKLRRHPVFWGWDFFLCFLGRCVKSAEFHFLNLPKPAFSCLRTVAFN